MLRRPAGLTPIVYLFPIVPAQPRPTRCCVPLPRTCTLTRSPPSLRCRLCRQALGLRATILRVFILVPGHQRVGEVCGGVRLVGWLVVQHGCGGRWLPPGGVLPTDLCRVNGYRWRSPPCTSPAPLSCPLSSHSPRTLVPIPLPRTPRTCSCCLCAPYRPPYRSYLCSSHLLPLTGHEPCESRIPRPTARPSPGPCLTRPHVLSFFPSQVLYEPAHHLRPTLELQHRHHLWGHVPSPRDSGPIVCAAPLLPRACSTARQIGDC